MPSETNWISEATKILDEVYPERWEKEDGLEGIGYCGFIVHFPEIIIRNSLEDSHRIQDFYWRFRFYESGRYRQMHGHRATLTQAEKQSHYPHSHCSSGVVINGEWGGFCLGDGPLKKQIREMKNGSFDPIKFEMFLHAFNIYIEWESLEGGPYQYMKDVRKKMGIEDVGILYKEDAYKRFINKCKTVNLTIEDGKKVTVDPVDEDFMDQLVPLLKDEHLVNRTERGEFYTEGTSQDYPPVNLYFKFKGVDIYQKVLEDEPEKQGKKYPHPSVAKYVAEKLSRKLTLHAITQRRETRGNSEGHLIGGVMVQDI